MTHDRDLYSFGYNYTIKNKRINILCPYDRRLFVFDRGKILIMGFRLIMI